MPLEADSLALDVNEGPATTIVVVEEVRKVFACKLAGEFFLFSSRLAGQVGSHQTTKTETYCLTGDRVHAQCRPDGWP
jgi:hypothetical protein